MARKYLDIDDVENSVCFYCDHCIGYIHGYYCGCGNDDFGDIENTDECDDFEQTDNEEEDDDNDDFDPTEPIECPRCGNDAYWEGSCYKCEQCGWCGKPD